MNETMSQEKSAEYRLKVKNGIESTVAKVITAPGSVKVWYMSRIYENIIQLRETIVTGIIWRSTKDVYITPNIEDIALEWKDYNLHLYYKKSKLSMLQRYEIACTSVDMSDDESPYHMACIRSSSYPYFTCLKEGRSFCPVTMVCDYIISSEIELDADNTVHLDRISKFFRKHIPTYECKMVTEKYRTVACSYGSGHIINRSDPLYLIEQIRQISIFSLKFILCVMAMYNYRCTRIFAEEGDSIVDDMFLTLPSLHTSFRQSYLEFEDGIVNHAKVFVTAPSGLVECHDGKHVIHLGTITSLSGALIGYFGYYMDE